MIGKNFGKRLARCVDATRASHFQETAPRLTAHAITKCTMRSGEPDLFEHRLSVSARSVYLLCHYQSLGPATFGTDNPSSVRSAFYEREDMWMDSILMNLRSMVYRNFRSIA